MQLHYQALCAALITGTLANPAPGHRPQKGCLTNAAAATLVDSFVSLFVDFEEGVARSILAPDFSEVSDSLNFLDPNNTKLSGEPTTSGVEEFIAYRYIVQTSFPVVPNFVVLNIWHNCDSFVFRWRQLASPIPAQGFDALELDRNTGLIKTEYSEFHTLAYLVNAGCDLNCPPGARI